MVASHFFMGEGSRRGSILLIYGQPDASRAVAIPVLPPVAAEESSSQVCKALRLQANALHTTKRTRFQGSACCAWCARDPRRGPSTTWCHHLIANGTVRTTWMGRMLSQPPRHKLPAREQAALGDARFAVMYRHGRVGQAWLRRLRIMGSCPPGISTRQSLRALICDIGTV